MQSIQFWQWWQRFLKKMGWGRKGVPTWGEEPPTILGICQRCGAIVMAGWHRQTPEGLQCWRCAGKKGGRK